MRRRCSSTPRSVTLCIVVSITPSNFDGYDMKVARGIHRMALLYCAVQSLQGIFPQSFAFRFSISGLFHIITRSEIRFLVSATGETNMTVRLRDLKIFDFIEELFGQLLRCSFFVHPS